LPDEIEVPFLQARPDFNIIVCVVISNSNLIKYPVVDTTERGIHLLVGGFKHVVFIILGMSSSQLTNSYFSEG
jgi:hypothetical protein